MLKCSQVKHTISALPLVEECNELGDGLLRMSTPFTYPNGEHVDVFLSYSANLFRGLRLTDLGQTTHYLQTAQVRAESTPRKREILSDITTQTGVRFASGDLYVELDDADLNNLTSHILHLSQACVRLSDFATHQRLRSSNPFRDDVEDFFEARNLAYVPDVRIAGQYGDIRIDYDIRAARNHAYVLVIAALNESSAHASATEIFSKWHDIQNVPASEEVRRVTIYNSQSRAIRSEDLSRLRDYSNVVSYPQEVDLLDSLLAA